MNRFSRGVWITLALLIIAVPAARGDTKVVVDRNEGDSATPDFKFKRVPRPSKTDAASKAKIAIIEGDRDPNGGDVDVLNDGKLPAEEDQPEANFFFQAGTPGGRLLFDLGDVIDVKQVNTYSWHANTRGPQVYKLYGSDGKGDGFDKKPAGGTDPQKAGWKLIAAVDTRPKDGPPGGQYGVSLFNPDGSLGKFRYLLFEMASTESDDPFGNTFYSEIDVLDREPAAVAEAPAPEQPQGDVKSYETADGKYSFTIDTKQAPELTEWADKELAPVVKEWYPKIVALLPSEGFEPPEKFSIVVTNRLPARIPAATGGSRVALNARWFAQNRKGEAKGAVVHELVHVVQQYGRARRDNPDAKRPPGWLIEGIPDYIRWFLYEPQTHGADIPARAADRVKYDNSYRVSANFLNFVTQHYDKDLVTQLNAACREGKYDDALFQKLTGKPLDELARAWKTSLGGLVEQPAPEHVVDVAIVGCAHIHTPDFEGRLKKRHDVKVKTVWDHDPQRAKKNAERMGVPVAENLEQIWNDPDIKAVIICSETVEHLPLVLAAVKAKKEIYAEKPLGMGAKDAYEMAKAIDDAGLLFQTGYFMRGDPKVLFLKEQVEKGSFGTITRIRGSNTHNGALGGWFDKDWRWMADPKQAGVGAYGDLGTHSLDLMLWLINEPVLRVTATTSPGTGRYEGCDELGEGILVFKNGTIGTLAAGWDDVANPVTLEIAGTEGHAAIVNDKLYFQSSKVSGADGKEPWTKLPEPMTHPFERFLDAVAGKKDAVLISADEAAYRCAVMEALYDSARNQKWADVQQPPRK